MKSLVLPSANEMGGGILESPVR